MVLSAAMFCVSAAIVQSAASDEPLTPVSPTTSATTLPAQTHWCEQRITLAQSSLKTLGANLTPLVEKTDSGEIHWTTGQVVAVGEGKATGTSGQQVEMAKRAAHLVAARNASLLLSGIRVGPGGYYKDIQQAQIHMDVILKNFKEVSSEFDPKTRTATVSLAVPVYGASGAVQLMNVMYRNTQQQPAQPPAAGSVKFVVIDARGSGFKPCLMPKIARESGKLLFDPAQSSAKPEEGCPVVYCALNPSDNLPANKTASAPAAGGVVVIQAQKSPAKSSGTLVIPDKDADSLIDLFATGGLFSEGNVAVIADAPATTTQPAK